MTFDEEGARALDAGDPSQRDQFLVPPVPDRPGEELAYLAGNSLGLQPRVTAQRLTAELDDWARLGVEGHLEAERPWLPYHELLREPAARLVGARPVEVVAMNSLTVNLHLMMLSFYRPTPERHAIVIEDTAFPSDSYAVRSQAALHGFDPDEAVIRLRAREGEAGLRSEDVVTFLREKGDTVALVLLGGVNYYSGEFLDIPAITRAGHDAGAVVGWDLAHAAGNVPLQLHDWDVDWAAWCTYKYLNSGPGAIAGAFVHERHLADRSLPRLEGWWSTDPATRFAMGPEVTPVASADAWQLSNPPILAMAPVLASLEMFDEVGIETLRARSERLTAYLEQALDDLCGDRALEIITPRDPARRGSQLSVRLLADDAGDVARALRERGVIADARQPDVIRLAPVPMYCGYHDCWRAARALAEVVRARG
ncbi:kynureninase [Nocardioides sp. JQ2195]|uniref:kynureninase n=1 Tax=Nocardioides sp. JQ2195 TaxID=2592334 RepID=UPI001F0F105F|nr:kynureninase [Nocardioides sp. JQ2195]